MSNATENQVLDNSNTEAAAPVVEKKGPALLKKLAQFQTPDGKIFQTQREATEHLRGYLVVEAITAVAAKFTGTKVVTNEETGEDEVVEQTLADFLLASKVDVLKAYDAAKVERAPVTEETKAKMKAAREAGVLKRALAAQPVEGGDAAPAGE